MVVILMDTLNHGIKTPFSLLKFIAQIEAVGAVENIDEILNFKEVDGVMVGPYDISGSLKIPGQLDHPKVVAASKKVIQACKKYKTLWNSNHRTQSKKC